MSRVPEVTKAIDPIGAGPAPLRNHYQSFTVLSMSSLLVVALLLWTESYGQKPLSCDLKQVGYRTAEPKHDHLEICTTKPNEPFDTATQKVIKHPFHATSKKGEYNAYTVACALYSLLVLVVNPNVIERRGCTIYKERTEWIAYVQPQTVCKFVCTALTGRGRLYV